MSNNNEIVTEPIEPKEQPIEQIEQKKPRVGGFRLVAILTFLLAVGGLFLGMVPQIPKVGGLIGFNLLKHADFYSKGLFLEGSLIGYVAKTFAEFNYAGLLGIFSDLSGGITGIINLAVSAMVGVAVLTSLICFILACIPSKTGKMTKNSAMCAAIFTFIAYFGLFAWNYARICCGIALPGEDALEAAKTFTLGMVDLPSAVIAGLMFVILAITALIRRGGRGFLNIVLLIFTFAAILGFIYPGTITAGLVDGCINKIQITKLETLLMPVAVLFLLAVLTFNLIASVARLCTRKHGFECFRFALLLLAVVLLHVAYIVTYTTDRWALFGLQITQLLPTIVLLVATLGAFVLSLLCAILFGRKDRKAAAAAKNVETATAEKVVAVQPVVEEHVEPSEFERKMYALAEAGLPEEETEEESEQTPVTFTPRHALKTPEE